jgi:hypothetical protein
MKSNEEIRAKWASEDMRDLSCLVELMIDIREILNNMHPTSKTPL